MIQNWYPQPTGNAVLDQIFKQIMSTIYSLFSTLSKQIAAIKPSPVSSSSVASGIPYNGPSVQSVVTSSRSLGTVFQNTNSTPMWVLVSLSLNSSGGGNVLISAFTDFAAVPTTVVGTLNLNNAGASTVTEGLSVMFVVLPGNFYKVAAQAGAPTIVNWVEWN